jgi:hypothetical protein
MKFIFIAMVALLTGCSTSQINLPYEQPVGCNSSDAIAQWKARMPQYTKKRILSELLMGNPDARIMATGGTPKTVERRDKDNKQVEVVVNELGNIVRAIDSRTGCDIGPLDFARRGVKL